MNAKLAPDRFESLLEQKLETSTELLSLLQEEHATLSGNDASALEQYGQRKSELVNRLEQLEQESRELVADKGFEADRGGMEHFIDTLQGEQQERTLAMWRELLSVLEENHRQNLVNGVVIELRQQSVAQVLAAITGQEDNRTYDPKGKTHSSTAGQSIAKV